MNAEPYNNEQTPIRELRYKHSRDFLPALNPDPSLRRSQAEGDCDQAA